MMLCSSTFENVQNAILESMKRQQNGETLRIDVVRCTVSETRWVHDNLPRRVAPRLRVTRVFLPPVGSQQTDLRNKAWCLSTVPSYR